MLNGKNWQTLVAGVADYGRERERLGELKAVSDVPFVSFDDPGILRVAEARREIAREFLGLPERTPFRSLDDVRDALEEALDAQQRLSIAVAKLEALSALYGTGKEED